MRVLNKFILVQRVLEQRESKSGLLLSGDDSNDMRYHKATVVETGTNIDGISSGDTVLFDKVSGHDVLIGDQRMSVIQEKDVVCVL
jgi:co-chaperonin GroES (HSP10)